MRRNLISNRALLIGSRRYVGLASNMNPLIDHAQENMDATVSESINEDNSVPESTTPSTSSATPFDLSPFSCPVGPVSLLEFDATPFDFFSLFFDNDITDPTVDPTNLYTTQKPPSARYKWCPTCSDEIKLFWKMIIAMVVHRLPQLEDYWSSNILLGVPGIVDGMLIDRFKVLLQCLHLNDNTEMKRPGIPIMIVCTS